MNVSTVFYRNQFHMVAYGNKLQITNKLCYDIQISVLIHTRKICHNFLISTYTHLTNVKLKRFCIFNSQYTIL